MSGAGNISYGVANNFVVKTGLEVGPTVIIAATGNLTTTGNIQVGSTVINGATGNITVGTTTINGATGEIRTSANVVTTSNFIVGTTVLSPSGAVTTNNIITTGGTINNTTIGGTTPAPAYFTTLDATGTLTTNDILPHVTNVSNIGSSTQRFQTIWVNDLRLSTNTLYLGDTPILGTTGTVVNVHTDPGQSLSLQTSGAAGAMSLVSAAPMALQTTGNNADVTIQSNGTGSKTKLLSTTALELTAPALTLTGATTNTGSFTVNGNTVLNGNVTITGTQATVNAAQLNVEDPVVILNSGEAGMGVTSGTSGIQFARGQLGSYQLVFKEADQSLQFGPVGSTIAMADKPWATTTFVANNSTATLTSLTTSGVVSIGTDLTVSGNLTVSGTTTTINATTLDVADINITIAKNAANATAANGAGLTIAGANATMLYGSVADNFVFNKSVSATSFVGPLTGAVTGNLTGNVTGNLIGNVTGDVTGNVTGNLTGTADKVVLTSSATTGSYPINWTTSGLLYYTPSITITPNTSTITATTFAGTATNSAALNTYTNSASAGVANRIVQADASGYIYNTYFNSSDNSAASGVTGVMVKVGDNNLRTGTAAAVATFLSGQTMNIVGSATTAGTITNQANSATITATSANTANTIVLRDASGNFSAGTITATATQATFADLAENYTADAEYEVGTVLEFGGDAEVTLATDGTRKLAGVVSTNPAYLMNSTLEGTKAAVALQGRVPCKVVGTVAKGDMLVAAGNGCARAEADPKLGQVIGKSLENFSGGEGVIEVVVGRM
jgi:hypothetical protein